MDKARYRGTTVVELLIVTLIGSMLSTIALATLVACIKTSAATSARVEVNENMERVLERIGKGIRAGTALGQVYLPLGTAPKWQCDNTTLVVQTPITDANGFNSYVEDIDPTTGDPVSRLNVETLVYEVTPNLLVPKTYNLQMTRYPGSAADGYVPGVAKPQMVMTKIIGPLDISGSRPKVFQYIDSADPNGIARDAVDTARPNDFKLVLVNLETQKQDARGRSVDTIGLKAEYYLHNCGR